MASTSEVEKTESVVEKRRFECRKCGLNCANLMNLQSHYHSYNHGNVEFPCDECGKIYSRSKSLKDHKKSAHSAKSCPAEQVYRCDECGKQSTLRWALQQHSYTHQSATISCKRCGEKLANPYQLATHMRQNHPIERKCRECGVQIPFKSPLYSNEFPSCDDCVSKHHRNAIPHRLLSNVFGCGKCPRQFSTRLDLNQHQFDSGHQPNVDQSQLDSTETQIHSGTEVEMIRDENVPVMKETRKSPVLLNAKRIVDNSTINNHSAEPIAEKCLKRLASETDSREIADLTTDPIKGKRPSMDSYIQSEIDRISRQLTVAQEKADRLANRQNLDGFECRLCGRTYLRLKNLQNHSKTHKKYKLGDVQSGKITSHPKSNPNGTDADPLVIEDEIITASSTDYQSAVGQILQHSVSVNSVTKRQNLYMCYQCGNTCANLRSLQKHSASHQIVEFPSIGPSGKIYSQPISLEDHKMLPQCIETVIGVAEVVVKNQRNSDCFECRHCGKTFGRRKNLRLHTYTHGICVKPKSLRNQIRLARQIEPSAMFQCDECLQLFNTQLDLNQHQSVHSREPNLNFYIVSQSAEILIDPVSMGLSVLIATACEIIQNCADRIQEILTSMDEATQLETPMETQMVGNPQSNPTENVDINKSQSV